jgi:hypothetical protein
MRRAILLSTIFLAIGCGREDTKPVVTSAISSSDGAVGTPCNESNKCPALILAINADAVVGGQLRGLVNQPGSWTFRGVAENGGARDIRLLGTSASIAGQFRIIDKMSVAIDYRATLPIVNPQPVTVAIRDVSLCKFLNPDKSTQCENLADRTSFPNLVQFHKDSSFQWSITEAAQTSATETPGTPLSECAKGAVGGVKTGAGGGFWSGLFGGIIGCAGGILGGK